MCGQVADTVYMQTIMQKWLILNANVAYMLALHLGKGLQKWEN